jgi:hypothetical protein
VGFAHVTLIETTVAHLQEIDVHPEHGRRGHRQETRNGSLRVGRDRGISFGDPYNLPRLLWNMPFYARIGFEVIPSQELSAALLSIIQDEIRRDLDPSGRVAMRRLRAV